MHSRALSIICTGLCCGFLCKHQYNDVCLVSLLGLHSPKFVSGFRSGGSLCSVMRSRVQKPQCNIAPGANANRHSYQKLIKRSGRANLFPETAEPPFTAPRAGQPSPEDGYCIFKSFIKSCFLKESGHCCLFCPAFWMLLTSRTLILSVAFSMIELKSL